MAQFDLVSLLQGVSKKWLSVLVGDMEQAKLLSDIMTQVVEDGKTTPAVENIFRFARYNFDHIKVVIIGQDPYFRGEADGLAFSAAHATIMPMSLKRIYRNLIDHGLMKQEPVKNWDLGYLASQGVLLMNTALTTKLDHQGKHIKLWAPYMDIVIRKLNKSLSSKTIWCLWGSDANKLAPVLAGNMVLRACHPIAMTKPSFSDCDHFVQIAAMCSDIIWDPDATETHFFTDCSARGNGREGCKASYGVVCTRGLLKGLSWAEEIKQKEIPFQNKIVVAKPTNIRAEGLAIVKALQLSRDLDAKIIIHSDSHFWIIDMLTKYIPGWAEQEIAFDQKKNSDIITRMWSLYQALKHKVEFQFVNAWHDRDRPADGTTDLYWWTGNQKAEEAAERVLGL